MDPSLIAAGVGLLGSVFGGKPAVPASVQRIYDLNVGASQRAQDLYDRTDLQSQDAQTVNDYAQGVLGYANKILSNYDAQAAGGGSGIYKADTQKDRARAQIAGDSASQIANLQADLSRTRPQRQAALLPNPGQAASGLQGGMYLDNQALSNNSANLNAIMSAGNLLGKLFGRSSSSSGGGYSPLSGGVDPFGNGTNYGIGGISQLPGVKYK